MLILTHEHRTEQGSNNDVLTLNPSYPKEKHYFY